ncbi:LolA-related protein [Dyella sp.]|uniref:LolA-related protein n=1 Tax=Dyella sp. TaxID=1869338 RepID=UPI002D7A28D0|nr:LolA-related protein [Dyella sp.]HET6430637.1 LolA-related protein [Dyella sp.]
MLMLCLSLPLVASASAPEGDPSAALIASLGRPAPARTAFAEARFMKLLDKPLMVSGELAWLGGDRLQRRVDAPRAESFTIAGGTVTQQREGKRPRSFSLRHAPQLQGLLDSFVALLSGDASRLAEAFLIERSGDAPAAWTLTLTPRDERVARTVSSIRIEGRGDEPRCMVMQEADGDAAIDLLGPLAAAMPATPTRDALIALCQAAP